MISAALNIGVTGLKAQQKAIDVVSNNIANVNTPGYSRQVVDLSTLAPEQLGGIAFGRGVDLTGVRRLVDPLINQSILNNSSQLSYWQNVNTGLNSIENVFGSLQSTGLASALDDFFLSWQQLSNNPQDAAQKFNVRSKSDVIVNNLNNMSQQLNNAQASANSTIDQTIIQANQLLSNITSLTTQIMKLENTGQSTVGTANDLRDQRDQALQDLSALIPVQQVQTSDGSFLVQTLDGQMLVQDNTARSLTRVAATAGTFSSIAIAETGQATTVTGGQIGGLIDLRDNLLGGYISQLDSISSNLIFSVNQLHASGVGTTGLTTTTAELGSNTALPLNDPTQASPFAAQIQTGSFSIHTYDATGAATPPGGTAIAITAGVTTINDVATALNGVAGITAAVDASGKLSISAAAGTTFALGGDTSNLLAAQQINSFFSGTSTSSMGISTSIQADVNAINTGRVDPLTSAISQGDNQLAVAILGLQNTPVSIDGTPLLSLHDRTATLSTTFGNDVSVSSQQLQYRTLESESLANQRAAVSGVNTDEELVSMIKYQRAYEASAKVISTSNTMLDSLLGLIR